MKKSYSLFIAIVCAYLSYGQAPASGDPFPFNDILSRKNKVAAKVIAEKKPRILDFFASGCVLCFKSLPKIKQYQEKFSGQMQFILVGLEDAGIRSTYKRFEEKLSLSFPVIFDSLLPAKLGIAYYPHYIWIDGNNIVRAITGLEELNETNIKKFLSGEEITLPVKQPAAFNPAGLLLDNNNGGEAGSLLFRSLLSEWTSEQPVYVPPSIYATKDPQKFQVLGTSLFSLYNYAYHGYGRWGVQDSLYGSVYPTVIIEPGDSTESIKADIEKGYSYSVVAARPNFDFADLQSAIRNDLQNYFGYEAFVSERLMPYWALRISDRKMAANLKANGGERSISITADEIVLKNAPVSELIKLLFARNQLQPPFMDETGITHNIDLFLNAVTFDLTDVQQKLLTKGIMLVKDYRPMKIILLKPKRVGVVSQMTGNTNRPF